MMLHDWAVVTRLILVLDDELVDDMKESPHKLN